MLLVISFLQTMPVLTSATVLYAVRQSHGPVTVRGRVSVRLSLDDVTHSQPTKPSKESADSARNRRGWSDDRPHLPTSSQAPPSSREPSILSTPTDGFQRVHGCDTPGNAETPQSQKRPILFPSTIHSHPPGPRSWTVRMPTATDGSQLPQSSAAPPTSPVHSPMSRFTRYIPRMSLFREVMRDEVR